jgi:integrase
VIRAARPYGLYAYVVLSLLVGVRTEEARALRWDHVDLEGNPDADPPVPPHVDVWRSLRAHGDTKTKKSRRSLGLPRMAVEVLREHLQRQADARLRAGVLWQDNGLVFTAALGTQLDAADVRRCRSGQSAGKRTSARSGLRANCESYHHGYTWPRPPQGRCGYRAGL